MSGCNLFYLIRHTITHIRARKTGCSELSVYYFVGLQVFKAAEWLRLYLNPIIFENMYEICIFNVS